MGEIRTLIITRLGDVVPVLFNDNEYMRNQTMLYRIELHQSTGETQNVFESDSLERIKKLWEQEKSLADEYTEFDDELTLRKSTDGFEDDNEMIDCYIIPNSQRGVDEMSFVVRYETEDHDNEIKRFTTLKEATICFNEQVAKAKEDVEKYFGVSPIDWNNESTPFIALDSLDTEGLGYGEITAWVPIEIRD